MSNIINGVVRAQLVFCVSAWCAGMPHLLGKTFFLYCVNIKNHAHNTSLYHLSPLTDLQQHPLLLLLECPVTTRSLKKCVLMVVTKGGQSSDCRILRYQHWSSDNISQSFSWILEVTQSLSMLLNVGFKVIKSLH